MEKGRLRKEGESIEKKRKRKDKLLGGNETVFDSFGNEIKVEKKVELTDKEKKKTIKIVTKTIKGWKKEKYINFRRNYRTRRKNRCYAKSVINNGYR